MNRAVSEPSLVREPYLTAPSAPAAAALDRWNGYPPKMQGPKDPSHDANAPIFDGQDIAGIVATAVITLAPLAAYSLGFGF